MPQEQASAPSPVQWAADGTPHSRQFKDSYRSYGPEGDQGLTQARHVFLQGCGLWPTDASDAPWCGQGKWHVLETGFGLGLNFLATWHAWRAQVQRPLHLFFTSIEAWPVTPEDIRKSAAPYPELHHLADELARAWTGLLPGVHRLDFDGGRVHLTLCIGPVERMLREPDVAADSVFLDGFSPEVNPQMWQADTLKAVARLCRTGTRLASWCVRRTVREDLEHCGFQVERKDGVPPKWQRLEARFAPHWTPLSRMRMPANAAVQRRAMVLGAGLAGAAVACSLAQRGWEVHVLDQGAQPGSGASGLPAGIVAPHVSADDGLLSRTTRAGVRATMQRAAQLQMSEADWRASGVLEHQVAGKHQLPSGERWPAAGLEWSRPADHDQKQLAGISSCSAALWHAMAGWIRPRQWVAAQLAQPGVQVRWNCAVSALRYQAGQWQALDAQGAVLHEAPCVVLAGGYATARLLHTIAGDEAHALLPLDSLRGQITWGAMDRLPPQAQDHLPPFPVNGHGSFVAPVAMPADWNGGASGWVLGSTFERNDTGVDVRESDHAANLQRLGALLPALAQSMSGGNCEAGMPPAGSGAGAGSTAGTSTSYEGWAALRCALPDRLPAVGMPAPERWPGLCVCTGMGARGISLSVLCAELLAAWLETEPLPLAQQLALRLAASRYGAKAAAARTTR